MFNRKEYIKQWRKNNPEKVKQYTKNSAKQHKLYMEKWRKNNPEKLRHIYIKSVYNLSHEDWLKILENQNGKCPICGKKFTDPRKVYIDHHHKTKKIRGLLCPKCNTAIGFLNDDPKLTARATEYLLEGVV